MRGSLTENIYEELGLQSLKSRRWYREMSFLNKVQNFLILHQIVIGNIKQEIQATFPFFAKNDYFKNSFFHSPITEWSKLDCYISNEDSFEVFKKRLLSFIRPMPNSIYNIHNPLGVIYLTRLRIGFSNLKEHKFKQLSRLNRSNVQLQ